MKPKKPKARKGRIAPRRNAKRALPPRKQAPRRTGTDARRVDAAVKRFEQAYRVAGTRADDLAALAHTIGEAAAAKQSAEIVRDWTERQFLRDLVALREAFGEQQTGTLSPRLETLRLLPDALLQWLEQRFGVEPIGRPGEEKELPAAKLTNYVCDFETPADPAALVRVRLVACGWKHGNLVLIPPSVRLSPQ